jgi:hypothetical protein
VVIVDRWEVQLVMEKERKKERDDGLEEMKTVQHKQNE